MAREMFTGPSHAADVPERNQCHPALLKRHLEGDFQCFIGDPIIIQPVLCTI